MRHQVTSLIIQIFITYTYLLHGTESFLRSQLVLQLIKKNPAFYGTRKFITVLTSTRHCLQRNHLAHEYFVTVLFHGEELLAPCPTPKLEDHPLSAVRDCLFDLFAATLHIGGRSSIRNLRTRHAVVTGTHKHGFINYKA